MRVLKKRILKVPKNGVKYHEITGENEIHFYFPVISYSYEPVCALMKGKKLRAPYFYKDYSR